MGLDAGTIEQIAGERDQDVLEENWEALQVFCAMGTQWRIHDYSGQLIGLEYQALRSVMEIFQVTDQRDCFDRVQVIEREVICQRAKSTKQV